MSQTAYKSTKMDGYFEKIQISPLCNRQNLDYYFNVFFFIYPLHGFPHGESCR